MSKSVFRIMALLVVLSLVVAACGGATATPSASPTPVVVVATPAPVVLSGDITIWSMPNGADPQAAIDAEIAAFNQLYPEINVTAEIVGWGDAYSQIQTAVQGGEGPCITQMGTTWVPTFGTMGGLHTFTAEEVADLGGVDTFAPTSWATALVYNNAVAVPWFADVRAILYRTDILEQAGLTAEEAFADTDSLIAALETIRDADLGVAPIVHPGRNDWNVWQNTSMWIWAYGGDILSADGTAAAFNSAEAVTGATTFFDLYADGLTPPDTLELNSAQAEANYGAGTSAMVITGPWMISNLRNVAASGYAQVVADNSAFYAFPAGPGGQYTFVGGSNLGIMTSCPNYEAAYAFVKFLLQDESQIRYGNAIGMFPVKLTAQNDASFTEDPMFSVFIPAAASGKSAMNIAKWGQVENTYNTALQGIWEQVATLGAGNPISEAQVKAALDDAAETVNALLSQ